MQPSQSGHARRSHHTRSSNLSPPPSGASEPPPLQPSRSETMYRNLNPFGPTQTQQKPSLPQNQSSFEVLSAPTKKVKHDQHNFTENVHDVRSSDEKQLKKQGHDMYTDKDEHDYQLKISSLKHLIGEGQHIKPQDVLQKGRHLPPDTDSVWNTRPNLQGLSQFSDEKNRIPIDAMLKEEEFSGKEIDNTGLIIPALKKPSPNLLGNNDILPLSNLYSHLKRQQMEQQLMQQQQQQQQHLAMLQARQQLILQQQEAKLMQQHIMKQIQPLDLYLQQQQQQQQMARQFQQNFNKYDQMSSLINQRKMGGQDVPEMLTSHPVFQYNNLLLAQQQQAGLNPHVLSGLNQRLNFNRQAENNESEATAGRNLEAEKITKIPELKFEDAMIKREEVVSDGSSKPPPSRKKNSMSSQEDNRKSQKSSTIESTPVTQSDNAKESGRARRKNKWQLLAEQQAQEKKGNEGMEETDPVQIARSNQAYIEGVREEKCTDCDFLLKVMVTDDPVSLGYENERHEYKVITEYSLENRTIHTGARYQANIPAICLKPSRPVNARKKALEPLWDPSAISKSELNGYFEDLCKSFNCKKINQERALKLLKRKNYKREKVKVNISKNEKFYSTFLAILETGGENGQEQPAAQ